MAGLLYSRSERENWQFRGSMTYDAYLTRLAACRWVLALDLKVSAGQVIAESAMLGVPVFSVVGKTNGDLVLPTELLLPRGVTALEAMAIVNRKTGRSPD